MWKFNELRHASDKEFAGPFSNLCGVGFSIKYCLEPCLVGSLQILGIVMRRGLSRLLALVRSTLP